MKISLFEYIIFGEDFIILKMNFFYEDCAINPNIKLIPLISNNFCFYFVFKSLLFFWIIIHLYILSFDFVNLIY